MLSAIASMFGGQVIDALIGKGADLFKAYLSKQISVEELRTALLKILVEQFAEIEKAHADALAKTYASFMQAMVQSKLMQAMWAAVVASQLVVLVWHQLGIPLLCFTLGNKSCYPSSGTTVEWAYLLLAACLGMGPIVLRAGPGAGNLASQMKAMIAK